MKAILTKLWERLDTLILTLWVGGIWVIGYVVAPVLFTTLDDRSTAGLVAGTLFSVMGQVGLYCGTLLLFLVVVGEQRLVKYRPLFMLWLVFEVAGRFSTLPVLYIGIVYLVVLGAFLRMEWHTGFTRYWQFWILLVMLLFTAIGYLYLAPEIEALRQIGEAGRASTHFKVLHGVSSTLYLLTSLAGIVLVVSGLPRHAR